MGVDAERGEHALVLLGELESGSARVETRSDRDNARDAGGTRTLEQRHRVIARVEVRVGVDHAAAVGASMRGNSGCAGSIPCTSPVTPYVTPDQPSVGACRS